MHRFPLIVLIAFATFTILMLTNPRPGAAQGQNSRVYLPLLFQPGPDLQTPEERAMSEGVLQLVNQERAAEGCTPLRFDNSLIKAAQGHSKDMAIRSYFDHISPEGAEFWQRARDAGYAGFAAAENIAAGQRSPQDVMASWMRSAGHRANILNCNYNEIGIGYYNLPGSPWGTYWTQVFGVR